MRSAIVVIALVTLALLTVRSAAMQFTDEGDWGVGDFALAGALLVGAGLAYLLVARRSLTGTVLVVAWAGLAV